MEEKKKSRSGDDTRASGTPAVAGKPPTGPSDHRRRKPKGAGGAHSSGKEKSDGGKSSKAAGDEKRANKSGGSGSAASRRWHGPTHVFSHLQDSEGTSKLWRKALAGTRLNVHPAILQLGRKYAEGTIVGANARCVSMLRAFMLFLADYVPPAHEAVSRDLDRSLKAQIDFLTNCRPHSIGMGNAVKHIRHCITRLDVSLEPGEAVRAVAREVERFAEERIVAATTNIAAQAAERVQDADVIATYGASSTVEAVLLAARAAGRDFRVIVLDSRPHESGKGLLQRLARAGVSCTYALVTAASYVMQDVTKVMLGAAAMLSNGSLLSRVGTAAVAAVAHAYNVPVLVCAETYKFTDKVHLDAAGWNELDESATLPTPIAVPAREAMRDGEESSKRKKPTPKVSPEPVMVVLKYDVTPREFIAMVISDAGVLPPTSVPVVVREHQDSLQV